MTNDAAGWDRAASGLTASKGVPVGGQRRCDDTLFPGGRTSSEASLLHHQSAATLLSVCEPEGESDDR
jgi:hypothetical protein